MSLQVDVQKIICTVGFENVETLSIFGGTEEGDGASDMRFQLQEISKRGVIQNFGLQVVSVHGCKRTETTIDGDIV